MAEEHEEHSGGADHEGGGGGHGGGGGGHAMEEEHEEGVAEWIVSFADNALLQMGFFVILLALNMKPDSNGHGGRPSEDDNTAEPSVAMVDGAIAIREAFNNPVNMSSSEMVDAPLIRRIIQRREGTSLEDGPPGDRRNVESVRPTDYRREGGLIIFDEGSATIDEHGMEVVKSLASKFAGRKTILEIRGHTSLAEAYRPMDKGMALSFERAMGVFHQLADAGIRPDQMRVVSVGAGDRASPQARARGERVNNQRVEIIVTDENLPDDPYSKDPSGG